jgi:carbamoyltransferase
MTDLPRLHHRSSEPRPIILGLSGGTAPVHGWSAAESDRRITAPAGTFHDAAAVLLRGGEVIAAVEEERLNRLKHTNRIARHAVRACLEIADVMLHEVDRVAYYVREDVMNGLAIGHALRHAHVPAAWTGQSYLARVLSEDLDYPFDPSCLAFVDHHVAHAASAYAVGPFRDALVVTLDGGGDGLAGTVSAGVGGTVTRLFETADSLGNLYLQVTRYLGYDLFDEYKVMGLAAYGDPSRFRHVFDAIIMLDADGRYRVSEAERRRALASLPPPRRAGDALTTVHQDVAAAAQEAVERATLHLLTHYRRETGLRYLCAAGGVLHNSTMVGKIARSGLFDGVFVQPAASDAGCALGAALATHQALAPAIRITPLRDAYLGPDVGSDDDIAEALEAWAELIVRRRSVDLAHDVAALLASGTVAGWVQGRSEFGPRALGNRSILADPRPAANKDRINALVKHREGYRPFAVSVLADQAGIYFQMPAGTGAGFMTLTVPVRAQARALLGAVTHVDGSTRIQTVSRETNPRFAALLEAFGTLTGMPALLNTSFNHSVEPIVESIDDAVTCLLTTRLDLLVAGDSLVTKANYPVQHLETLVPSLPDYVRIVQARQPDAQGGYADSFRCEHVIPVRSRDVTRATCAVLQQCDGRRRLREMIETWPIPADRPDTLGQIAELWASRLLRLLPAVTIERHGRPVGVRTTITSAHREVIP